MQNRDEYWSVTEYTLNVHQLAFGATVFHKWSYAEQRWAHLALQPSQTDLKNDPFALFLICTNMIPSDLQFHVNGGTQSCLTV